MVVMVATNLLFWGLLAAGIVLLVAYVRRGVSVGTPTGQVRTPQQVLADRFAGGDIDEQEYRERLEVLSGTASTYGSPR